MLSVVRCGISGKPAAVLKCGQCAAPSAEVKRRRASPSQFEVEPAADDYAVGFEVLAANKSRYAGEPRTQRRSGQKRGRAQIIVKRFEFGGPIAGQDPFRADARNPADLGDGRAGREVETNLAPTKFVLSASCA